MVHICHGRHSATREDKRLPFATTRGDPERVLLNLSQAEKGQAAMPLTGGTPNRKQQADQLQAQSTAPWPPEGKGSGEDEEGNGGQIHGDRRRLDLGWWAHRATGRWHHTEGCA